ncbi:adenylate cyclase class 1 [Nicoletella semolina]|uniref:Adenylate cyclase class 1 n=1 Tax=Nicoletella semolina TaxID=271160 RepID=A0A4R2NBG8_9PAST|nr:class I adenylate cyclase [Nicoletella semolina]MDH2924802.1 adenylate cyclase [Nicoletella semolina]TCP18335.1 adenylate cyclase class 1 [Nicoletella semolina]
MEKRVPIYQNSHSLPSHNSYDIADLSHSIEIAKGRITKIEQARIYQALSHCSESFKTVFSLLPILLHYNHPALVAYTPNAPHGIAHFLPNADQSSYLATLFDEPHYYYSTAFDGLYAMGSFGSITQTSLSDLDIWLCYSRPFSDAQLTALKEKIVKIQQWGQSLRVEINLYLMNPSEFKTHRYTSELNEEHSGSAQHYFLLDEFYRSAVRLAGKPILWLHLPETSLPYQVLVDQAVAAHIIRLEEWVDFGDLNNLSAGEYFGATLWQLYKGIENPYKSAIKILLLESYAEVYPNTTLISRQLKKQLFSEDQACNFDPNLFDPYLAMLEQATHYLENCKEFARLDCLRQCFYIKAIEQQTDPRKRQKLRALAYTWHWQENDIQLLEMRSQWKIKQAMRHQKMLIEQLLQSYRNLIRFARKYQIDPSIMPQDTDILARKLYSVFEVLPGKITLINDKIGQNLAEDEVTFIEVIDTGSAKAGWYLVNNAPSMPYDPAKRYVQHQKSLNKLVAWAYFNGLITAETQLHIVSQCVNLSKLRQFITDLRNSFPIKAPTMDYMDFYHPNEIRNLILAVNLTCDPTIEIPARTEFSAINLLNLSTSDYPIIGSISLIYRNMWNEVITQHLEGNDALLKMLKFISNKIYRNSAPPQSVNVFCYSRQFSKTIKKSVEELVNRCISVQLGTLYEKQPYLIRLEGNSWQMLFNPSSCSMTLPPNMTTATALKPPKEIYNFASEGFLQFFFEDNADKSFNVYILDKKNQLESYFNCAGQKVERIKQITLAYADSINLEQSDYSDNFNFPQFYQLLNQKNEILIVPFQSRQHREYLTQL